MKLNVKNGLIAGFVSGDFFGPWTREEAMHVALLLLDACARVKGEGEGDATTERVLRALDVLTGPQSD